MPSTAETEASRQRWLPWVAPLLAILLYLPTLTYPFIFDDFTFLADNEAIRSLENIPSFFLDAGTATSSGFSAGVYRPVRNVVWSFEYKLWGDWPGGYHLGNALFHALNGFLLWWLSVGLFAPMGREGARFGATAAAVLWVVHPLASEAVAWIKSVDDLLVAGFCLLGGGVAARLSWGDRANRADADNSAARVPWSLAVIVLAHVGAVLSKESGAVYPAIVLLVLWASHRMRRESLLARRGTRVAVVVLVGTGFLINSLYLALRGKVVGRLAQVSEPLASGSELFWTQMRATARGLQLVVCPFGFVADYSAYRVSTGPGVTELVSLVIVSGLLAAAILGIRHIPMLTLAVGIWFVGVLPVSNLVPTMQFLAERFLYLPLVGPALFVGWVLARPWRRQSTASIAVRRRVLLVCLGLVALLISRTTTRIPVWSSDVELFASVIREAPSNLRALEGHALALFYRGRYAESLETLAAVEKIDRQHDVIENLREDALVLVDSDAEIERLLKKIEESPDDLEAKLRFGELAGRARRKGAARPMFEQVIEATPRDWRGWAGLAWVEVLEGEERKAWQALETAKVLAGDDAEAASFLQTRAHRMSRELERVLNTTWRRLAIERALAERREQRPRERDN